MLEILFNSNCLRYDILVRRYFKELNISEKTALILIDILDIYSQKKEFKEAYLKDYVYTKEEIEVALVELLQGDYVEIFFEINSDGKQVESYRISPFFQKCEKMLKEKDLKTKDNYQSDIALIYSILEDKLKRTLTGLEMQMTQSWFDDDYDIQSIKDAIDAASKQGIFRIKNVEKILYKLDSKPKSNDAIAEVFNMMRK